MNKVKLWLQRPKISEWTQVVPVPQVSPLNEKYIFQYYLLNIYIILNFKENIISIVIKYLKKII